MKQLLFLLLFAASLGAARAQIRIDDAELSLRSSRVRMEVEDLQNFGTNTTGKLRIVLFATDDEWDDTNDRKALAKFAVKRLQPGQYRHDVHKTVHMRRPDHWGWYWLTVAVQERARDANGTLRWITRDFIAFDRAVYFASSSHEAPWPF